jgi:hypothetical protein
MPFWAKPYWVGAIALIGRANSRDLRRAAEMTIPEHHLEREGSSPVTPTS